ncbi:MAG: energy-coupling factor transporter transmembrane component T family protein [Candidatus Baldrarchaeia archaeon]
MSYTMFSAFEFKRKDTYIHKLDPRTKMFMTIVFMTAALLFTTIIPLLITFIATLIPILLAKSVKEWLNSLKGTTILLIFILVINSFIRDLNFALAMILRLIVLITAFSVFFLTTHPDDLAQALIQMKVPFDFAFALSMATRYVPTLAREAQTIMDAQMSRGLELQKGGLTQKIRNLIPLIIPLIVNSVRRALSIAESLESRAFGAIKKRTYLYQLKLKKNDFIFIIFLTSYLLLMIYIKMYSPLASWMEWKFPL